MIAQPFAIVLSAARSQLNRKVAEARRRDPAFDCAAFAVFLECGVDPLVRALVAIDAGRVPQLVLAAYDAALELTGQGLVGPNARASGVNQVWQTVAPHCAHLLARSPAEVLGLLTNAIVHLEKTASARPAQWLAELARWAPQVQSWTQLQALGQLLAWRAGLSHFRTGALAASVALPAPLLAQMFGVGVDAWPAAREAMLADPWWGATPQFAGVEIGAFSGFGGDFVEPPQLRSCEDGFLVNGGERYFLLVADLHGAVLHGASEAEFAAGGENRRTGPLRSDIALDLPPQQLSIIVNAHTLAVMSPFTHAFRLLPLRCASRQP